MYVKLFLSKGGMTNSISVTRGFFLFFFSSHFVSLLWQAERRRKLGLPPEEPSVAKPSTVVEEKKV